jgi:DNA-binding GntR family transcriptional regulator
LPLLRAIVYNSTEMGAQENDSGRVESTLYGSIVEKIMSGEFPAGRRLVEEELARKYNVSRTPVREVLFALQRDGLVERVRNQGARVVSFTPDDVEEIFDLRKALECFCVPKAVRTLKLNDLLGLERRLGSLIESRGSKWGDQAAEIDLELHAIIVKGSANRRLIAYTERIRRLQHSLQLAGYRIEEHVRQSAREHLGIVRALLRRDVELAQTLLAEHIENGKGHALERFFDRGRAIRA